MDRTVKTWSQTLLHIVRVHIHIFDLMLKGDNPDKVRRLHEQMFQLQAEVYWKLKKLSAGNFDSRLCCERHRAAV